MPASLPSKLHPRVNGLAPIGKLMMAAGGLLLALGALVWWAARVLPGQGLSGDLHYQRGNFSLFVPLASCLVLSLILTLVLNLAGRWLGR